MRRLLILAVALVAILGVLAPPALAQAPAPKVTITGLIDQVGTYTKNMSQYDGNLNINRDVQLYGRTRGRFDVIGEVGKAKAVLGIEIDSYWGQTGFTDSNNGPGWQCSTVNGSCASGAVGSGAESSFDLNTDTQGNLQIKWLYTEFPLPLVPLNSVVRLGAQPFGTAATYKLATYANGDFPGVNLVVDLAPGAKLMLTYVAVDEQLTGKRDFFPLTFGGSASTDGKCTGTAGGPVLSCIPQSRNDNWALIASFEMSPFKGLDIKPMYSYFEAIGQTSQAARQGRGGVVVASSISGVTGGQANSPFNPIGAAAGVGAAGAASNDGAGTNTLETRHTIGVDARFTAGPFSLQPTVLYQFGHQEKWLLGGQSAPYGAVGTKARADISAWLVDVRAGFNVGPLSLGGLVAWTSGDPAKSNPYRHIGYFTPLDTDTGYLADWGTQIMSLGIDYYQGSLSLGQNGLSEGVAIGYDKYGRIVTGAKASYALTPALTAGAGLTLTWTDKSVDTDGFLVANGGIQPQFFCRNNPTQNCRPEGDSRFLGTEANVALTYRFAPGLALDVAGGWLFAGPAFGHRYAGTTYATTGPQQMDQGIKDVLIGTARVRYQF